MTPVNLPVNKATIGAALSLLLCQRALAATDGEAQRTAITDLYRQQEAVRSITNVALSPDGSRLVWNVTRNKGGTETTYVAPAGEPGHGLRMSARTGHTQS